MASNNKKDHAVRILQWNAQSAVAKKQSLQLFLYENDIDIALINETWFRPGHDVNFAGYNIIRQDRVDGKAGVSIFVSKKLTFSKMNFVSNFNTGIMVCGATILIHDKNINFVSVYRPPNILTNERDWNNLFSQIKAPCVVGGDFNAHSKTWGSAKNCKVGEHILNVIDDSNLTILNNGSATRRVRPSENKSAVDLTLCSVDICNRCHWDISSDTLGSDHYPIVITFESLGICQGQIHPKIKWNTKEANWPFYTCFIDSKISNPNSFLNTQEKYDFLINCINEAAQLSIPIYKPFSYNRRPPPPWWDPIDCEPVIQKRKQILRNYKQNPSLDNYILCKKTEAETKKFLKNKARDSWISWCSKLNKNTSSATLWSQARKMSRKPVYNKANNNQWFDEFFDKVAPPTVEVNHSPNIGHINKNHFLCRALSIDELECILKTTENTAPGYDEIQYCMLSNLPINAKLLMLEIFNDIYLYSAHIKDFENVVVIPIQKPGKDPNSGSSYRPISLLSCIQKTLERMIKQRIEFWIINHNLLPENQYGYKKGFGTMDAISQIVIDIQNCFTDNEYLYSLFLDIQGAYDSVDLKILEQKLVNHFKIPINISRSIVNLYSKRSVFIRNDKNERIGPRYVFTGLPQGSVLSPILFNLYTADIHTLTSFKIVQYADDFCIYTQNKNYDRGITDIATAFQKTSDWSRNNGFEISPEKSSLVVFSRHNTPNTNFVVLNDTQVAFRKEVKYLGVILDKKLSWKNHIDNLTTRCEKGLNFLRSVTKTWWGCDITTALVFYKSYIRSILDYGSILYGFATKTNLIKVDRIQYKALRICLGAMRSTPTEALLVEALEPPLTLRREVLCTKFLAKHRFFNTSLYNSILKLGISDLVNKYWEHKKSPPLCEAIRDYNNLLNTIPLFTPSNHDYYSTFEKIPIKFPKFTNDRNINKNILKAELENYKETIFIYTDASKTEQGNGAAFYIPQLNIEFKFKLDSNCSIFTSEAYAIQEALDYILIGNNRKYVILTDSMSVLKSLDTVKPWTYKTNSAIWSIRKSYRRNKLKNNHISFVWVKAHTGLEGNEYVDKLAKDSICDGSLTEYAFVLSDVNICVKSIIKHKWSQRWQSYCRNSSTNYSLLVPKIPNNFWHQNYNVSRRYIVSMIRLKFGHACYPAHLNKIHILHSDQCDVCHTSGDLNHIFFECIKYKDQIQNLCDILTKEFNVIAPFNLNHLLSLDNPNVFNEIMFFLRETNLKI